MIFLSLKGSPIMFSKMSAVILSYSRKQTPLFKHLLKHFASSFYVSRFYVTILGQIRVFPKHHHEGFLLAAIQAKLVGFPKKALDLGLLKGREAMHGGIYLEGGKGVSNLPAAPLLNTVLVNW